MMNEVGESTQDGVDSRAVVPGECVTPLNLETVSAAVQPTASQADRTQWHLVQHTASSQFPTEVPEITYVPKQGVTANDVVLGNRNRKKGKRNERLHEVVARILDPTNPGSCDTWAVIKAVEFVGGRFLKEEDDGRLRQIDTSHADERRIIGSAAIGGNGPKHRLLKQYRLKHGIEDSKPPAKRKSKSEASSSATTTASQRQRRMHASTEAFVPMGTGPLAAHNSDDGSPIEGTANAVTETPTSSLDDPEDIEPYPLVPGDEYGIGDLQDLSVFPDPWLFVDEDDRQQVMGCNAARLARAGIHLGESPSELTLSQTKDEATPPWQENRSTADGTGYNSFSRGIEDSNSSALLSFGQTQRNPATATDCLDQSVEDQALEDTELSQGQSMTRHVANGNLEEEPLDFAAEPSNALATTDVEMLLDMF